MSKTREVLNIILQRDMNCYSNNAYFLNCILAYENMYPWVYENYIQLYFTENKVMRNTGNKEVFLDFFAGWTEPRNVLKCRNYNRDVIEKVDIISFIETQILEGFYVYTYLDEYYTVFLQKQHLCHDISIYGFDRDKKELYVIGFNEVFTYTKYVIDYETFYKAYKAGLDLSNKFEPEGGINYLIGIMPDFDLEKVHKINIENMLSDLFDYLNCINTSKKFITSDPNFKMYSDENNHYGIVVYDMLIEYIETSSNLEVLDYRIFHAMYEHKNLMSKRLHYLKEEIKYPLTSDDISKVDDIADQFNKIRFKVLKHNISLQKSIRTDLIRVLREQQKVEFEALSNIYNCLKQEKVFISGGYGE